MKKVTTIYDIAAELNISASTVSRALNDHKDIKEETRLKVHEKAIELGYQKNVYASNLRTKSKLLLMILPDNARSTNALAVVQRIVEESGGQLLANPLDKG